MKRREIFRKRGVLLMITVSVATFIVFGCGSRKTKMTSTLKDRFNVLIEYIENNGDFIQSEIAPAAVNADEVMKNINGNIHIIDIRTADDYMQGHIEGAVNVPFKDIIDYFEQSIHSKTFDKIYIFSSDGQAAFFVTSLLRLLGYENVYAVRYGMCAWDKTIAEKYWLQKISSKYSSLMTTEPFSMAESGPYPNVLSTSESGYNILRERAIQLLQHPYKTYVKDIDTVMKDPSKYYIVCYWKEEYYNVGHIPGAIHYEPKKSLSRNTYLNTLPPDKPIVVYCNSGNHSSAVVAYLRVLGYDAYSLHYGTNSFMHDIMIEKTGHAFTEDLIFNYPLQKTNNPENTSPVVIKHESPQGGC